MAKILLATDDIQNKTADKKTLDKVAELLRQKGHTVTTNGVGPNQVQQLAYRQNGDIMIQIAGGKCFGTLGDFYYGNYKPPKRGFMYFKTFSTTWKCHREPRDHFSQHLDLTKWEGKTLPVVFQDMKPKMYYGYGDTAEEMVNTFLQDYTGNTNTNTNNTNNSGGGGILDAIKKVLSEIDPYGIDLLLDGDEVIIKKTNPSTATPLNTDNIVQGSININDYDSNTPNTLGNIKDEYLIQRFGQIPLESNITTQDKTTLLMGQRGYNHTIDLKVILNHNYKTGQWVTLTIPEVGINKRQYMITKNSYDENMIMSLTLEPGPPSRYIEETEEIEEETSDDTDTTEEDTEV